MEPRALERGGALLDSGNWRGPSGGTSLAVSTVVLVKATIGTAVLVLPHEFAQTGWGLALLLLVCLAGANVFSLHALAEARRAARATSYAACVRALLGARAAFALDIVQVIYMLGALISMMRILLDQLASVAGPSPWASVALLWGVSLLALMPLTLRRRLSELWLTSAAGVLALMLLPALALLRAPWRRGFGLLLCGKAPGSSYRAWRLRGAPATLGVAALSFECQVNYLPILSELRNPTRRRVWALVSGAVVLDLLFYLLTSMVAYASFCDTVKPDILDNYSDDDPLASATRAAFSLQVALSFPLTSIILRDVLDAILPPHHESRSARHSTVRFCSLGCAAVLVPCAVASFRPPLDVLAALTGAVGGAALAFVFPGALLFETRRRANALRDGFGDELDAPLLLMTTDAREAAPDVGAAGNLAPPLLLAAAGIALGLWSTYAELTAR